MRQTIHILLAFLVLIGSVGVPVSRHFCQGELKSIAFYGKAEKCHKDQKKAHCPFHPAPAEEKVDDNKKGCCDDEYELVQIDDQEPVNTVVLPAIVATLLDFQPLLPDYLAPHPRPRKNTNFENYRPPPLALDVVREYQVFRI